MDTERLKTFLLLSELKSFTEVAHQLYISQPAVSKQMKSLEDELGVPLFSRIGQKNHLTIQGKAFKQYAQTIVNTYAIAKEHILQIESLEKGHMSFGATNFIGVYLMPEILSVFKNKFPKIDINFSIASSKKIIKQFENASIEFAVLSGYVDLSSDMYVIQKIFNDELKIIVNSNHKLATRESVTFKELKNETFILKDVDSSLHHFLVKRIGENNFKDKNIITISNQEGIKEAVIKNLGISFMSQKAVNYEVKLGHLKMITLLDYDLERSINLVYKKKYTLTPAAKEFIQCIKENNQAIKKTSSDF